MMPLEELLREKIYWTAEIQLELFRQIADYLETNQLSRKQFAEQLGVSKGYVSQIMNGQFDHKLSKLVALSIAIGKVPKIKFKDLSSVIQQAKGERPELYKVYSKQTTAKINLPKAPAGVKPSKTPHPDPTFTKVA